MLYGSGEGMDKGGQIHDMAKGNVSTSVLLSKSAAGSKVYC